MDERIQAYLQGASLTGYTVFGAHFVHEYGQDGVRFAVYAPQASQVALVGDFNDWQGWQMERQECGVWSIFARDIESGARYKYRITSADGTQDHADPFAFFSEKRPNTASMVYQMEGYSWRDADFLRTREKNYQKPMNIYEIHAGSWKRQENGEFLNYDALADALIPYVKEMHFTHIELLPLTEHPFDGSWGYQTAGYFSATSRYGQPKQLMRFIERCHLEGIGVIMDFVPLHFVQDSYALCRFDGSYLYESENETRRCSEWGTTLLDYTKPHVLSFMKSALDFWITYYHVDGIRFDAVSCLIYHGGLPENGVNDAGVWFLKNATFALGQKWHDVMLIAEDSSMYLKVTAPVTYGGLGFDYKWDLGFMNDTFHYFGGHNRKASRISASTEYFYQEKYILPFSHDEVVHCKKPIVQKTAGTEQERLAQARTLYLYLYTHPGKKLNFMGNEFAARTEWNENIALDWTLLHQPDHRAFQRFFAALGAFYGSQPALYETDLHPEGFAWVRAQDGVFVYRRRSLTGSALLVILNFSGKQYSALSVPAEAGVWQERISTESTDFGGDGQTNGTLTAAKGNLMLRLPPFGGCVLQNTKC